MLKEKEVKKLKKWRNKKWQHNKINPKSGT
jgi:hypothetical protein